MAEAIKRRIGIGWVEVTMAKTVAIIALSLVVLGLLVYPTIRTHAALPNMSQGSSHSATPVPGIIRGTEPRSTRIAPISIAHATARRVLRVDIRMRKVEAGDDRECWGRDDVNAPTRVDTVTITLEGQDLILRGDLVGGIGDIDPKSTRVLQDGVTTYVQFGGGDAAASYSATLAITGNRASRYIEHGEMGPMISERSDFVDGHLRVLDQHSEYNDD